MAIELNHTIVPAYDKVASAMFFARMFGLSYSGEAGHFAPVRINDSLTFDFDTHETVARQHYAFKVDDETFDAVLARVKAENLPFGSGPGTPEDGKLNNWNGGRGFYFRDPNGHLLELLTASG